MEAIIAKIDNDFNPDNSDWIPRVAAWVTDAMMQLKILRTVPVTRDLIVNNRIANNYCTFDIKSLKVYDINGCELPEAGKSCGCSSTGDRTKPIGGAETTGSVDTDYTGQDHMNDIAFHVDVDDVTKQKEVYSLQPPVPRRGISNRNYVIIDGNKLELNFDADIITITENEIETEYSELYSERIPVIPNNGKLIEALSHYCIYKMLTRGYKHPVFNLAASQYGTNPYYIWNSTKEAARASVIADNQDLDAADKEWQSAFYNYSFPKR